MSSNVVRFSLFYIGGHPWHPSLMLSLLGKRGVDIMVAAGGIYLHV
jgi:hypothetical protein